MSIIFGVAMLIVTILIVAIFQKVSRMKKDHFADVGKMVRYGIFTTFTNYYRFIDYLLKIRHSVYSKTICSSLT